MPDIPDIILRALHASRLEASTSSSSSSSGASLKGNILTLSTGRRLFARAVSGSSSVTQARGEVEGLRHMSITGSDIAPRLYRFECLSDGTKAAVLSDYFDLSGGMKEGDQRELARNLARMHTPPTIDQLQIARFQANGLDSADVDSETLGLGDGGSGAKYGFPVPTHCGVTEQDNTWEEDWAVFFGQRRLGDMVRRIGDKSIEKEWVAMQGKVIPLLLSNFTPAPRPVILHGDLWSGNKGLDSASGRPVIFDPAAYYGHNEADLGIMHMFGGFSAAFFDEYHKHHPRSGPYYDQRQKLYELYHHLNHTLMFGGGYKSGALSIMRSLNSWAETV